MCKSSAAQRLSTDYGGERTFVPGYTSVLCGTVQYFTVEYWSKGDKREKKGREQDSL